jgi:hypothetical protein
MRIRNIHTGNIHYDGGKLLKGAEDEIPDAEADRLIACGFAESVGGVSAPPPVPDLDDEDEDDEEE